jgi:nitrogenase-associated protein
MAHIIFFEKPGCGGNAKQKAWLVAAGHTLDVRSLLAWPWTRESLLGWLGALPVADWFNRAAPAVRDGEIRPESVSGDEAIALMLATPLLIRRPLIELPDGTRLVGFNESQLRAHLDAAAAAQAPGEGCARGMTPCEPA